MSSSTEYMYSKTHEWVRFLDGETALTGVSDFAQRSLGDIVFINLPVQGESVTNGEAYADVESVKAVSDVISPITGVIIEVNESLEENPGKINESPYEAWIAKIGNITAITAIENLMTADEYEKFCEEQGE